MTLIACASCILSVFIAYFSREKELLVTEDKSLKDEYCTLQEQLQEKSTELDVTRNQILTDQEHLRACQISLEEKETELDVARNQLLTDQEHLCACQIALEEKDRECRTLQGKYNQLREQFQEKSNTLEETRAQLFTSEEKLQKLQLEAREQACSQKKEDNFFNQYLLRVEKKYAKAVENQALEIEHLHDLIGSLMKE